MCLADGCLDALQLKPVVGDVALQKAQSLFQGNAPGNRVFEYELFLYAIGCGPDPMRNVVVRMHP